jgi:hypothetical protein
MDAFRKQLDALMGANRNGDVLEVKRNYYDRDVCRLYLTGLCPHDLFQLTVSPFFRSCNLRLKDLDFCSTRRLLLHSMLLRLSLISAMKTEQNFSLHSRGGFFSIIVRFLSRTSGFSK